ncbi:hypothetical protein, partial [Vibrio paracholerae]|uniref:hypothetical protein n=1 Tax=Vibrio paracholerae TaxID=650003 RepID=UPI003F996AB4
GSSPAGGATFKNPVIDWVFFYLHFELFLVSLSNHPTSTSLSVSLFFLFRGKNLIQLILSHLLRINK